MSSKLPYDILVLLDNNFENAGDPRVYRTLKALRHNGYKVALLCMQSPSLSEFEIIDDFPVYRIFPRAISRPRSLFTERIKATHNILNRFSFKAVLCNDQLMLDIGVRLKRKNKNLLLIYDTHEYFQDYQEEYPNDTSYLTILKSRLWRKFEMWKERRNIIKSDIRMTISQSFAEFINNDNHKEPACLVIRNIPDFPNEAPSTDKFNFPELKKLNDNPGSKHIIYFGDYYKKLNGLETVFYAISRLPQEICLIIVGNDKSNGYFTSLAKDLNIEQRIVPIPRVPQPYLISLAQYASISVIPTMEYKYKQVLYSLPNKLFDSIMLEIPVICSSLPEHSRIISTHNNGILTNGSDWNKAPGDIVSAYFEICNNYTMFKENAIIAKTKFNYLIEYLPLMNQLKKNLNA